MTDGDGESGELMQSPHFPTEDVDAKVMLRDKGNASYLIILLLGAGFMFPFFGFVFLSILSEWAAFHPTYFAESWRGCRFTSAVDFMNDQYPSHPEVISNLATAYNLGQSEERGQSVCPPISLVDPCSCVFFVVDLSARNTADLSHTGGFVVYFLVLLYLGKFTIRSRILVCFSLEFILVALTPFWHVMIKDESTALWLVYTSLFVLGMWSCRSGGEGGGGGPFPLPLCAFMFLPLATVWVVSTMSFCSHG